MDIIRPAGLGSCTTPPVGGTGAITCTLASFASGATASFQFTFNVNPTAPSGGTSTNTATISSTTTDPNSANNSSAVNTVIGASIPALSPAALALLGAMLAAMALFAARR